MGGDWSAGLNVNVRGRCLAGSKKAFFREFKKVVKAADVILEVLDARDPLGCRCLDVEQMIITQDPNKKIILILNKIGTRTSFNSANRSLAFSLECHRVCVRVRVRGVVV